MGIEEEKIDQIIDAHSETVDALKAERDGYKEDAAKSYLQAFVGKANLFISLLFFPKTERINIIRYTELLLKRLLKSQKVAML